MTMIIILSSLLNMKVIYLYFTHKNTLNTLQKLWVINMVQIKPDCCKKFGKTFELYWLLLI